MSRWAALLWVIVSCACGVLLACSSESNEAPAQQLRQSSTLEEVLWTRLGLPAAATARAFHGAVYQPALESILLFGGRQSDDSGASLYDSGLVNGAAWSELSSTFAPRGYLTGVFDSARSRIVTYGGLNVGLISGVTHYAETWEFDASDSSWALRTALSLPGRRGGYGLAYDSRRKVTVLFGGFDRSWKDDIYEWNGTTWTKACATAACSAAPRPGARALPVFVYDEARGVSLLFGGNGPEGLLGDTWSWDGVRWTLLEPAVAPPPRDASAATYDPVSRRVLIFGGGFSDAHATGDFWAWNGAEWSSIAQTKPPPNRRGGALVWDLKRRRGVLVGGTAQDRVSDAWTFVLNGGPCNATSECHSGACVQGTCSVTPDNGNMGGAGGDASQNGGASDPGGSGSVGGTATGGTAITPTGGQFASAGNAGSGGSVPVPGGGASAAASGVGGTTSTGTGSLGSGSVAGTTQTPTHRNLPAGSQRSFYSCSVQRADSGRSPLALLCLSVAILVVGSRRRRHRQRASSGPAPPPW